MSAIRLAWLLVLFCISGLAGAATDDPRSDAFWYGTAPDGTPTVRLYYFYSPTCPHCQAAKPFIAGLETKHPWLEIERYVVKDHRANARFYFDTAQSLGVEALSVPGLVFCRQVMIGYDSAATTGKQLEDALNACHERRLANPGAPDPEAGGSAAAAGGAPQLSAAEEKAGTTVTVPLLGEIDAKALSLPILTLVLAGMDAFNPCAFFVLLFLLSLLVHAKSRQRMAIIGGTFVLFSGLVYFVFMAAWLNVFLIAGELRVITFVAGLLALTVAALNIKDYFWFKAGPSLSIPDAAKPGLFKRMREVVASGSMGPMLVSTVLLAIVANSYELLCTAGFPMVYTRALTLADLESWQYYAWLAAYNVIYVLPLLAIVTVFTWTMGARKLSEAEGRLLKLISGFMMLGFGLLLLIAPNMLTNALASIFVLAAAVGASLVVARVAAPRPA
ncbi:MAG: thioredoxin family protein [Gammaproteobacteria bacterium]|nr:thioredoxin family protein [Gammaproteobacteria bacterium]MDH4311867.1 thioredoxin family protein [Gammaproteobacteria bacterium]MDH5274477.1 thioredoxin family protein [Gammaproteobacteria bacterium]